MHRISDFQVTINWCIVDLLMHMYLSKTDVGGINNGSTFPLSRAFLEAVFSQMALEYSATNNTVVVSLSMFVSVFVVTLKSRPTVSLICFNVAYLLD